MNIPLPYLQALVVFGDSQNMTQAASRLGLTQSALSKQLQGLEKLLPQKAMAFDGRKKVLTPYGRNLTHDLREKFDGLSEVVRLAGHRWTSEKDTSIRFGASKDLLAKYASEISFKGNLLFSEGDSASLLDLLLKKQMDVILSPNLPARSEIGSKLLAKEHYQILIPKKMIKDKPSFTDGLLKRLATQPSLEDDISNSMITQVYRHYGFSTRPSPKRALKNWDALTTWTEQGLGWTIAPSTQTVVEKLVHRIAVPASVLPTKSVFLLYRKDLQTTPWFKVFLQQF